MALALREAHAAERVDEVPIGAIVVLDGRLLSRAHNLTRTRCDPTAHAEVLALSKAARKLGAQRLPGALSHARVARVVWAVRDPKFGGCASLGNVLSDPRLNHRAQITEGVCAAEARALLQGFFRKKRGRSVEE